MIIGKKYDTDKLKYSLLPKKVIEDVIKVLMIGEKKYGTDNWIYVDNGYERYYNACLRHLQAWYYGEKLDTESGISHIIHAICCLMFIDWKDKNEFNHYL